MAVVLESQPTSAMQPRAVLCGSFRRDGVGLRGALAQLKACGCEVLSPRSIDFVAEIDGFVLTEDELDDDPWVIETRHIAAVRAADFLWLHAPDGYIGPSAALEVGIAHSLDIPVWADTAPVDHTIAQFVRVTTSPVEAVAASMSAGSHTPAAPLRDLQSYYERMANERGFDRESPQDTMLLLTEEVGELARAIRKTVGIARAGGDDADPASELADVQLYLLHLANTVGIDLAAAVHAKERLNQQRYSRVAA